MFETTLTDVIAVDTHNNTIHFYSAPSAGRRDNHIVVSYNCQAFTDEFYEKFDRILKAYQQRYPTTNANKVSLLLPDHLFLTDTIDIPAIGKRAMENSLELAISALYKNKADLKYSTYPMVQNKQYATYGMVGVRKDLITRVTDVCANNQINVQNITFAANAMVNGALTLNTKLKTGTFLLMNVQESKTRFAFVNKGRTVGAYDLPFGHAMLYKSRLAAEDLLFDHSSAELLVLNAKEKAKAKQLTMLGEEVLVDPDDERPEQEQPEQPDDPELDPTEGRKGGRKLPKFMLRPIPTEREGFIFENFRILERWALELIASNPAITAMGSIDTVYVNMPRSYDFLFDMVNAEEAENGVKFQSLMQGAANDGSAAGAKDLELFGGLYVKLFNKINNF
ncbi:MAG: hypothetical protein IKK11_02855 [Oscillospiraceae bacterium]|nr:hypothetical protein [Oscillospiraceae bacterium]